MAANRKMVVGLAVLGVLALAARHPTADLRLITHDVRDPSPHQMRAAVDFGLVGVSVLYTWTVDRLR